MENLYYIPYVNILSILILQCSNYYAVILHFAQLGLMYFSIVETKGRSLEALEEIFNDEKPVQKSLQRYDVVLVTGHGLKLEPLA